MRRLRVLIGVFCLFGVAACTHLDPYLDVVREKGVSEEYLATLKEWSRSQTVYSQFDTQALISATYQSPEFNRVYHDEYSRIYHLRKEERKVKENTQAALSADYTEFMLYAYTPEKSSNDFDRRGSIWTVYLVNGKGDRIDPVEIRRVDPITPITTEFFPYVNPYYGIVYRVRFTPLSKAGRDDTPLKLVFVSVLGKVELTFDGR